MPSRSELAALFPNASPAFLDANAAPGAAEEGPPPQRLSLPRALRQLVLAGSEEDWMAFVTSAAEERGWQWRHITHTTIAKKSGEQVGDHNARDIPDLLLWRADTGQAMWRELKKAGGKLSDGQLKFIDDMRACGLDADCWWPQDLDRVLEELA